MNEFASIALLGVSLGLVFGLIGMLKTTLRVISFVAKEQPSFILKSIAIGFISAGVGYYFTDAVKITIFVCGTLGFLCYLLFILFSR